MHTAYFFDLNNFLYLYLCNVGQSSRTMIFSSEIPQISFKISITADCIAELFGLWTTIILLYGSTYCLLFYSTPHMRFLPTI